MTRNALFVVAAFAFGWTAAVCASRDEARTGAPDQAARHSRGQPFVSQSVLADAPAPWGTWSLAAYQSLVSRSNGDSISVSGTLSSGGRIALTLHHRPNDTTSALVITEGESPQGLSMQLDGAGRALRCTGSLSVVKPGPFAVTMARGGPGWTATMGGETLSCTSADGVGHPSVTAGLRRVSLNTVAVGSTVAAPVTMQFAAVGLGTGLLALLVLVMGGRWIPTSAAAAATAMLTAAPLTAIDGGRLGEALRLIGAREDWLPITMSVTLVGLIAAVGAGARLSHRAAWLAGLPPLAFALLVAAAWSVSGLHGWVYTLGFSVALGALVWTQAHASTVRFYNGVSFVLACAVIGTLEVMVRFSAVGNVWNASNTQQGAGSTATLIEQFEDLEAGRFTAYPAKGFPVRLAAKRAEQRVVCLGASSTGGAFQNDSLAEFYPALLDQLSPETTEAVNQGVGGWNSFHLRKFIDGHADRLDGDIWTIYLGVNENLPTAMPFADLYDAWQQGELTERTQALDNVRLFQGLRLLVRGLRPGGGVGVSADDLRDNLEHIIGVANQRDVRVLLMSEGVRPDPRVLWHYFEVMDDLAKRHSNVEYLDTATMLDQYNDRAFIDTNHLTANGHTRVARTIDAELRRLGWY